MHATLCQVMEDILSGELRPEEVTEALRRDIREARDEERHRVERAMRREEQIDAERRAGFMKFRGPGGQGRATATDSTEEGVAVGGKQVKVSKEVCAFL